MIRTSTSPQARTILEELDDNPATSLFGAALSELATSFDLQSGEAVLEVIAEEGLVFDQAVLFIDVTGAEEECDWWEWFNKLC